jgi:hypothetical protein
MTTQNETRAALAQIAAARPNVTLYDVFNKDGEFVMRATLRVIGAFYNLHRDATARIVREASVHAADGNLCVLYFNRGDGDKIYVQYAIGSRNN